ncbi:hypothetical protein EV182_003655, partial [Spiromyces aspiralis]
MSTHRKKPFSNKQKKQQLKDKRAKKRSLWDEPEGHKQSTHDSGNQVDLEQQQQQQQQQSNAETERHVETVPPPAKTDK